MENKQKEENNFFTTHCLKSQSNIEIGNCCRICLAKGNHHQDADSSLISPCECKGSLMFVHESCLLAWIENKQQTFAQEGKNEIPCEICQTPIKYEVQSENVCRSTEEIKSKIVEEKQYFIIALIILIPLMSLIIVITVLLQTSTSLKKSFLIATVAISVLLLLIHLILTFKAFFMKKKNKITFIFQKKAP